jgi:hypothetical protein
LSKYRENKTEYKDEKCLVEALNAQGYSEVEVHAEAQHLYGYKGDKREETANVIVRRQYIDSAANDLGFKKQADGTYSAIVSDYDSTRHNTAWFKNLKRNYAEAGLNKVAKQQGWRLVRKTDVNGKTQIEFLDPKVRN